MNHRTKWLVLLGTLCLLSISLVGFRTYQESDIQNQIGDSWGIFTNFETGEDLFSTSIEDIGQAIYTNGGLELSLYEKLFYYRSVLFETPPESFIASVEFQLESNNEYTSAGFICNYDYRNNNGIYFEVGFDQTYAIYTIENDIYTYLVDLDTQNPYWATDVQDPFYPTEVINPNGINELTVSCDQNHYQMQVNGTLLADINTSLDFASTNLSLYTLNYADQDSVILFDNFYAEEIGTKSYQIDPATPWGAYTEFDQQYGYFTDWSNEYGSVSHIENALEIQVYQADDINFAVFEPESPINKFVEIEASLASGDLESGVGISCDFFQDPSDSQVYGTLFIITFDGYYSIIRNMPDSTMVLVNNQWQTMDPNSNSYMPSDLISNYGINTIRTECDHGTHAFYINGTRVAQYDDFEPDYPTSISISGTTYQNPNSTIRIESFYAGSYEAFSPSEETPSSSGKPTTNQESYDRSSDFLYYADDGTPFYYDPFNNSQTSLFNEYFPDEPYSIAIQDGGMRMDTNGKGILLSNAPYMTYPSDYAIDVEVYLNDSNAPETVAGVACGYSGNDEMPSRPFGYGVFMEITFDGYYALYENTQAGVAYYTNGEWAYFSGAVDEIPDLYQPTDLVNTNGKNILTLGCLENNFTFTLNNVLLANSDTLSLNQNGVALLYTGTFYEPSTSVIFDEFILIDATY